jgi:hypothetical protein
LEDWNTAGEQDDEDNNENPVFFDDSKNSIGNDDDENDRDNWLDADGEVLQKLYVNVFYLGH